MHFPNMLEFLLCLLILLTSPSAASPAVAAGSRNVVPNKYIVTFKPGVNPMDIESHLAMAGLSNSHARRPEHHPDPPLAGIERRYNISTFQAYAGAFSNEAIAEISASPVVASVEHDQLMYPAGMVTQADTSSWGLGAISHRRGAGTTEYIYDDGSRRETFAYVIDSGVREDHRDFGGRVSLDWSFDDTEGDSLGHGTHVAGTIVGHEYGVSKSTKVIAVKVFGESGSSDTSTILDGYNWVVDDILGHHGNHPSRARVSAINMSIGGGVTLALNAAIEAALEVGILTIVAAGNGAQDASLSSPASSPGALTVGATTDANAMASYSNFGSSVNILAPGSLITSAGRDSPTAEETQDGTSMATPHVTGLAVYLMSLYEYEKPRDVWNHLLQLGTRDVISGVPQGTPNLLAYNGNGAW